MWAENYALNQKSIIIIYLFVCLLGTQKIYFIYW
jgi:hypothetical protein